MRLLRVPLALALSACGAAELPRAIGWSELTNPVLTRTEAIKDAYAVRHDGRWHLGYSHLSEEPSFRVRLGFSVTDDFTTVINRDDLDQPEVGGLASPDVVRRPEGGFVMTYNSHTRDVGSSLNKLYYRTSDDLERWSDAKRIHIDGLEGADERLIDAALAFHQGQAYLFFKRDQTSAVAHSPSGSLDGPWAYLGPTDPAEIENAQVIFFDGKWHLIGTTLPVIHRPNLYRMEGDPADPQSWRTFKRLRELKIPEQAWNTGDNPLNYEVANSGYLIDQRHDDGYFYLLYAGSTELVTYMGRGYSSLGLARSTDLGTWEVR